jgi:hypothetical protein
VSGPDAVFRLENKNGNVIYLFGEIHNSLQYQNECEISQNSLRIDQLLKKVFKKNKNTKIGFFLETHPSFNNYAKHNLYQYIDSLRSLFKDNVNFDKNNKIQKSVIFPNVMFNFFDIRSEGCFNYYYDLLNIQINLSNYNNILFKIYSQTNCVLENETLYSLQKITKKKYKNADIKKAIFQIYEQSKNRYKNIQNESIKLNEEREKKLKTFHKEKFFLSSEKRTQLINNLFYPVDNLLQEITYLGAILCDLYLLRRLLDKNYDTKINYVYSGVFHTINIVLFLLKFTDYKITHSTSVTDHLEKEYKKYNVEWLLNNSDLLSINVIGVDLKYEETPQCVDISHFPKYLT